VDGLGSTRALTDSNGLVSDRYAYEAFGEIIKQLGNTKNLYLFAGEQRDPNLGLDYLRARYLDVNTGRFFATDPFSGVIRQPNTLHKFIYTGNNPTNFIDPSGKFFAFAMGLVPSFTLFLPQFIFAGHLIIAIKYLIQPGFTLRYGSMELMTLASDNATFEESQRLYELSGKLIGAGANYAQTAQSLLDIGKSVSSLSGKIQTLALDPSNIKRIGTYGGIYFDLQSLHSAANKASNSANNLSQMLEPSRSTSNQAIANESGTLQKILESFLKLAFNLMGKLG
jgi:RHS repeat-associated protein